MTKVVAGLSWLREAGGGCAGLLVLRLAREKDIKRLNIHNTSHSLAVRITLYHIEPLQFS